MNNAFGSYLRQLRLERGISLRAFCLRIRADASNYSKLERGLLMPPDDPGRLADLCGALGLDPEGEESRELKRLAALGRGMVPPATLSDPALVGKLPLFFRTLEGDPIDEAKMEELVAMIRKVWAHDSSGSI